MNNYLTINYFKNELGEHDYPQLLCNHIVKKYFLENGNVRGMKILDVGSGKGNHLIGFFRCGMIVYGLDKRNECRETLKNFDIRECDIENEKFPFEDNFFDFVFSKSVLDHVQNTDSFFNEIFRVLKPGAKAVILTPDWKSQFKFFWDDYTHVKPFTRKGLQNAMKINNFSNVKCEYFLQLPFLWNRPYLKFIVSIIAFSPDSFKWKDKEESKRRKLIQFSKEKMLLAQGIKSV